MATNEGVRKLALALCNQLGIQEDELARYRVVWEGEEFSLLDFAVANARTPSVIQELLSVPLGTRLQVPDGERLSSPFYLRIRSPPRRHVKPAKDALNADDYYTIEMHVTGGGFLERTEHVRGRDVAKAKRSLGRLAPDGERVRYVVLREGAEPQRVSVYKSTRAIPRPGLKKGLWK